jgi:aspartate/methionine/tyrosine aminotransferase
MPISELPEALHLSDRVRGLGSGVFARNDQRKQAYRANAAAAGLPPLLDLSLGSTDLQPPEAAIQAIRDQLGRPESAAYCLHRGAQSG